MKRSTAVLAAIVLLSLAAVQPAPAATRIGSECSADQISMSGFLMVQEKKSSGSAVPVASPGAGILTSWTFRADAFGVEPEPGYMKVLRLVAPGTFEVVGESTSELLGPGVHTYPARIPVQAGDRVGLYATSGSFYCDEGGGEDLIWSLNRNLAVGSSATFAANAPGIQVPVSATIEADADADGYGDETQDGCPQLAAVHEVPCPALTLSFLAQAGRKAVVVYVAAGIQAQIAVSAKAGKARLKAVTKLVDPGKLTKFKLPIGGALQRKLGALPPSKSLPLKVTAAGANAAGVAAAVTRTVRLKGRGSR